MAGKRRVVVNDIGEVSVVRFIDRKIVDSANIEEMGEELFTVVEKDKRKFILLNFDGVEFLSSAALNKLILLDRKAKAAGGKLKLCGLRAEIMEVFTITRLDKVFQIKKTEADGIEAFGL